MPEMRGGDPGKVLTEPARLRKVLMDYCRQDPMGLVEVKDSVQIHWT